MAREITGKVVVVTGASSGIGRATALAFARQGANLVLTGRQVEPLREVAAECETVGAPAIVVTADVRDRLAMDEVAKRAEEAFDRIDVWVNNAAVYMLGKLEDTPPEAFREIIDTNILGTVNGCRSALPYVRATGGVIINVASVASTMGMPLASAYVSSKWAVRGFSESLRQELREDGVDVVTIMPATIDTPLFEHAANYTGRAIQAMPPIYSADKVADKIVAATRRPRPEVMVGGAGKVMRLMRALLPVRLFEAIAARQVEKNHLADTPSADTFGNLAAPRPPFAVHGGWRKPNGTRGMLTKAALGVGLAAAIPAVVAVIRRRQRAQFPWYLA